MILTSLHFTSFHCRWSRTCLQRALCNASAASASDTRSETAVTRFGASRVGALTCPVGAQPRGSGLSAAAVGGNHTANYRGCAKWKEAKTAFAKQAPQRAPRNTARGHPAVAKAQQAGPSAEQLALGEGWSHVVRGGCAAKATATTPPPNPNPTPQPVTEVPRQPKVTATRKKAGPKNPEPKPTEAVQPAAGKPKKKVAASVKTATTKHTTPVLVVPTKALEEIPDLLDRLPLQACVELTRRLLTSISSLPTGTSRPRAVLKTVIPFVA